MHYFYILILFFFLVLAIFTFLEFWARLKVGWVFPVSYPLEGFALFGSKSRTSWMASTNRNIHQIRSKWRSYGIFAIWSDLGPWTRRPETWTSIVVTDNDKIREVVTDNDMFQKPESRGLYRLMHAESCTQANGERMVRQRKILSKIITTACQWGQPVVISNVRRFVGWIEKEVEEGRSTIDFQKSFSVLSADFILELVLGRSFLETYPDFKLKFLRFWDVFRLPSANGRTVMLMHELFEQIRMSVDSTVFRRLYQSDGERCLMNEMIRYYADPEEGVTASLSTYEIIHNVWSFLVAGFETVAGGLTLTMYNLARHPMYFDQIKEETVGILQPKEGSDFSIYRYPILSSCIRETLRLYPPVLNMPRVTTSSGCPFGFGVPKGTHVLADILSAHLNPKVFIDPMSYRPERWLEKGSRLSSHYWAFGGGSKSCLGRPLGSMEIGMTVSGLVERFRFSLPSDYGLELAQTPTLRVMNKDGLPLLVERL